MSTTRPIVTQEPSQTYRQSTQPVQQLRTAFAPARLPESASQCPELRRVTVVAACDRFLLRKVDGAFTTFCPACAAHGWVGHPEGCEFGAGAQICEGRVHELIAAGRASYLLRQGFTRVEGE